MVDHTTIEHLLSPSGNNRFASQNSGENHMPRFQFAPVRETQPITSMDVNLGCQQSNNEIRGRQMIDLSH